MSESVMPAPGIQLRSRISYGFSLKHAMTRMTCGGTGQYGSSCTVVKGATASCTHLCFARDERGFLVEDLVEFCVVEQELVLDGLFKLVLALAVLHLFRHAVHGLSERRPSCREGKRWKRCPSKLGERRSPAPCPPANLDGAQRGSHRRRAGAERPAHAAAAAGVRARQVEHRRLDRPDPLGQDERSTHTAAERATATMEDERVLLLLLCVRHDRPADVVHPTPRHQRCVVPFLLNLPTLHIRSSVQLPLPQNLANCTGRSQGDSRKDGFSGCQS